MSDRGRPHWLAILARTEHAVLAAASAGLVPQYVVLRGPEAGLIMLRGRMGGSGAPFNLGETSVTRCTVKSEAGYVGHAYSIGRRPLQAELSAAIDSGLQDERYHAALYEQVVLPCEAAIAEQRAQTARRAAATQVQFFTMATMRT